jgi:hypothetical protein
MDRYLTVSQQNILLNTMYDLNTQISLEEIRTLINDEFIYDGLVYTVDLCSFALDGVVPHFV